MWTALEVTIGTYAAMVGCIYAVQRHLMYHPLKSIGSPASYGVGELADLFIEAPGQPKLQAWVCGPRREGFPTILYFHGNAANLGDRAGKFAGFISAGFGLVALSYRGYGKSEGSPSEAGIYEDARAAVAYAKEKLGVPAARLIFFGESLGSGVAVQMATEQTPGLVVLEAAYTSVETRSAELYPFVLGVRQLVLDKYDSLAKIEKVRSPLVMLHGRLDSVIPLAHAQALFAAANEPKELILYDQVHHADFSIEQVLMPVLKSGKKYGLLPANQTLAD